MPIYTLTFADDDHGLAKRLDFTAPDAGGALAAARTEAENRPAELWLGTKRLCRVQRADEVWYITP